MSADQEMRRNEEDAVRSSTAGATVVVAVMGLATGIRSAPPVRADGDAFALNGRFAATSDGAYATTNYAFHNEPSVRSIWTITSTCTTEIRCTGQVVSDQGWTAPAHTESHVWYVERDLPNWETCPDGTSFAGHQTFSFYPSNASGVTQVGAPYLEGKDKTVGQRYACGTTWYGKPLVIDMPFRLDRMP